MNAISTPLYFRSGNETLFGWLHQPEVGARSDVGVVICKPFGYEAVCAHRSMRVFAEAYAAVGISVLRFDYTGTGDSSGSDSPADQIAQWTSDIAAAIALLQQSCDVRRVCLLGVRMGALLASIVASTHSMVDALIAVAPVVNGKRYLRELRTFQAASMASDSMPIASRAVADGSLEVTGFRLSAATVERMGHIELPVPGRAVANALVLDRGDLPGAKLWADTLLGLGSDVRYRALPGFAEMVLTPHAAQVPIAMLDATVEWLQRYRHTSAAAPVTTPVATPVTSMEICSDDGTELVERALYVDPERTLFAIITEPLRTAASATSKRRYGIVMLNGGAINHIGPNRMYVELSRRWAARDYVVLRLDLAGLGDSATRPGRDGNEVYPPGALDDIAAAIEFLKRQYDVEDITLAGLCAGAYHALRSATAGLPVNTVLMVNPLTFHWKEGSTLNDLQISDVVRNPGVYAEHVLTRKHWVKLLRGRVNVWRVAMVYLRRMGLALDSTVRDLSRKLRIRLPNDLGWDLESIAARGVRIVFLFARGDTGAELLKVQGGSAIKTMGDRCRIHTIDGADHIFSQGAARAQLLQLLSSELPK